jgi:hypothetical protein
MEELRSELASAFVASTLGIPTNIPHHASYIANWIKPLKDHKRKILRDAVLLATCFGPLHNAGITPAAPGELRTWSLAFIRTTRPRWRPGRRHPSRKLSAR